MCGVFFVSTCIYFLTLTIVDDILFKSKQAVTRKVVYQSIVFESYPKPYKLQRLKWCLLQVKCFGIIRDKSHLFRAIIITYGLYTAPIQLQDILVKIRDIVSRSIKAYLYDVLTCSGVLYLSHWGPVSIAKIMVVNNLHEGFRRYFTLISLAVIWVQSHCERYPVVLHSRTQCNRRRRSGVGAAVHEKNLTGMGD